MRNRSLSYDRVRRGTRKTLKMKKSRVRTNQIKNTQYYRRQSFIRNLINNPLKYYMWQKIKNYPHVYSKHYDIRKPLEKAKEDDDNGGDEAINTAVHRGIRYLLRAVKERTNYPKRVIINNPVVSKKPKRNWRREYKGVREVSGPLRSSPIKTR